MDAIVTPGLNHTSSIKTRDHVRLYELQETYAAFASQINILSLDCFDTLIWRKTIEPKDVFFELAQRPLFQSLKIAAMNRIDAESNARTLTLIRHGHYEVTLNDIYRTGFATLTEAEIAQLIEEEIKTEMECCYAHPKLIELIHTAHQSGKKVIIVSNTYFNQLQLKRLLAHALPDDVYAMINEVFCSCEYNQSKNNGLFKIVLSKLGEQNHAMLHIGDDFSADYDSPKKQGIHALHLRQFDATQNEYLRMQTHSATMLNADIHHTRALYSPFRGLFSAMPLSTEKPETLIGYLSLGPILYTFARYLQEEVEALKRANKKPKVLFMMRDAYLPSLAVEALLGEPMGPRVRISRFCATAASIRSSKDIEECLAAILDESDWESTCRQLLLSKITTDTIISQAQADKSPRYAFNQLILQPDTVNYIINQSKAFWERLKRYLQNEAAIEKGDTVVLVDLGYIGRSQKWLTPILEKELEVSVTGRYLIALNALEWHQSRRGLIDPSWCDDRSLKLLSGGAHLLEELCTSNDKSVIDYDPQGNPIFTETGVKKGQNTKTKIIQEQCLSFIRDAKQFFNSTSRTSFPISLLRDVTLAELARRTYLPLSAEIDYLQDYQHDIDMGTNLCFSAGSHNENELTNLRRQGLWFKNQHPHGLRAAGLELSLALMASTRNGLMIELDDMSLRRENILVLQSQGGTVTKKLIGATPTYEGYFSLWFTVNQTDLQIAIMFGLNYKALQIENIDLTPSHSFLKDKHFYAVKDINEYAIFNEMTAKEDHFYECMSSQSSLLISLKENHMTTPQSVLRIIFRPIIKRVTTA